MAKVNFIRKHTKAEVNDEPIVDGNFIVTGDGGTFIDYGEERVPINGTIVVKNEKTESDTNVYSCNYINSLKPSVITVGLENNIDFSDNNLVVPLNKIMAYSGSKFLLVDNKIKIGTGVSKIKVSGTLLEQVDSTGLFGAYICKNGINLVNAINVGFSYIPTTNDMYKVSLPPMIVDVTAGDLISLTAYTQSNGATVTIQAYSGRATNLTIEEVIE